MNYIYKKELLEKYKEKLYQTVIIQIIVWIILLIHIIIKKKTQK